MIAVVEASVIEINSFFIYLFCFTFIHSFIDLVLIISPLYCRYLSMSASPGTHDALVICMVEYLRQLGYTVQDPLPETTDLYDTPLFSSFTATNSPNLTPIDSSSVPPPTSLMLPPTSELLSTLPRPLNQLCDCCKFEVEPNLGLSVFCKWCTAVTTSCCKIGQRAHLRESLKWREWEYQGRAQLSVQVQANGQVRLKKQKKIDSRQLSFLPESVHLHLNQTQRVTSHP